MHVDLSSEISAFNPATKYKIYFEGSSSKTNDFITIDNIRLLIPN
mgnify:CR=1 FL=1